MGHEIFFSPVTASFFVGKLFAQKCFLKSITGPV